MSERVVNGRVYPLWNQFIDNKVAWIGGTLEDHDMGECFKTEITDITLEPNGGDSAMFSVVGKDFTCGFDVHYGGISAGETGWLTFSGQLGHSWRIKSSPAYIATAGQKLQEMPDVDVDHPFAQAIKESQALQEEDRLKRLSQEETYIGDGLYASYNGDTFKLRAPRVDANDIVHLEPEVMVDFFRFVAIKLGAQITVKGKNGNVMQFDERGRSS